jgi:hypothetical protein
MHRVADRRAVVSVRGCSNAALHRCNIVEALHCCNIASLQHRCSIVAALQGNAQYDRRLVDLFFDHVLGVENVGDKHSLQAAQPHRPDALEAAPMPATRR